MTEQHEDERLRRWEREQAEIERKADALVLSTLSAMVKAADDLKSRLRRDTGAIIDAYRRTRQGLEGDIALAGAERQRLRREAENERDAILKDARERAQEILADAERQRETLLADLRAREARLLDLERQPIADGDTDSDIEVGEVDAPPVEVAAVALDEPADTDAESTAEPVTTSPSEPLEDTELAPAPAPATPAEPPKRPFEVAPSIAAILTSPPSPRVPAPPPLAPTPPPPTVPVSMQAASTLPAPDAQHAIPAESPLEAAPPTPAPPPRQVWLVFTGVHAYQQAMALERAVSDLAADGDVEIDEFEQGRLVLTARVGDLTGLATQLVASAPASLTLDGTTGDIATFRYI